MDDQQWDRPEAPADLMARLGNKTRAARKSRQLSRRALSELSGVSQRYLAQLEAGSGNMSIALLDKVATALGCDLAWLVSKQESPQWAENSLEMRYHRLPDKLRCQIDTILEQASMPQGRGQRIALIGLRGAGKSTLGRIIAAQTGVEFVEINDFIRQKAGMSLSELMELYGPEEYRKMEFQLLQDICAEKTEVILALSGGIVEDSKSVQLLNKACHTVWLKAAPEDYMARVRAQGDDRPMSGQPEAMQILRSILERRQAAYGNADYQIETSGKNVGESSRELLALIQPLLNAAAS
jgi:XRE family aerobic/anaerobic benzoate catabolism transcriptional regulator